MLLGRAMPHFSYLINVRCQSFPCDPNGKTLRLHNNALQSHIWVTYANCKFLRGQGDPETSVSGKMIDTTTIEQKVYLKKILSCS